MVNARMIVGIMLCAGVVHAHSPVITTMAPKYHGRHMACGGKYDKRDSFVAINRAGYCGDTAWVHHGFMAVRVVIGDRFNTCKDSLPFLKVDSPAWVLQVLGLRGKAGLDSVVIFHAGRRVVFK
jgi:hypothetical protein